MLPLRDDRKPTDSFSTSGRRLAFSGLSMEYLAQLRLGPIQDLSPSGRERFAAAVDLEIEHRHRRPEGARFAPLARLSGPFQRQRDLSRAVLLKNTALQVERITSLHNAGGTICQWLSPCCEELCDCDALGRAWCSVKPCWVAPFFQVSDFSLMLASGLTAYCARPGASASGL